MKNMLSTTAVILMLLWVIGYLGFNLTGLIHVLLVMTVIVVVLRLVQGRKLI